MNLSLWAAIFLMWHVKEVRPLNLISKYDPTEHISIIDGLAKKLRNLKVT